MVAVWTAFFGDTSRAAVERARVLVGATDITGVAGVIVFPDRDDEEDVPVMPAESIVAKASAVAAAKAASFI
jgi:hypothetical protein